ncbi:hypothetical protein EMIHUDRAFT_236499 [Emiliania huxleyi CCMP1516]|uniref:Uncharacterized protein n=2 Tax=Emiliania huxleyi TaxID=2903 RepID=A0A0D3JTI0_EMIH1|nr:hypothetical protein EMIHUDRAFT_236499 [Emiliania huxleyi CCMP1516]EOD26815.1 hypothetical protein EMIHUDRAFT_236499 [Emiliania huxleyi CCMP1516]|eukprot:XP_005779244.1 hypothetical protein EMIHUDRAFT_236499 [Emiliania huxleyi CCMP1516]
MAARAAALDGLKVHRWGGPMSADAMPSARWGSSAAPTLGCLLRALFAPSAWLAAAVEARRRELFGDGAAGTAFRPGTVPTTDRRMTVDGAVSVNPVFQHNFTRESVQDIFVMLAHSRCFHHASSNFATTVLAFAPPGACHGHYSL